ncbi:MAG: aldehyde dehydrogenase family protein [Anaerolineae bacterium]
MANEYKMYIGGAWVDAKGGETFADYNPATGELWAQIPKGERADAKVAVDAAHNARTAWADTPHPQRAAYFLKVEGLRATHPSVAGFSFWQQVYDRPCCIKFPGILNYTPRGARRTA